MGLSRLDNFLKSARGTILYVNPNDLDATDSIENQGNSLGRPFKTIQRALIESARFSYQRGLNNDRFGKTTILIYPGDHIVDNRPGWIPYDDGGIARYRMRDGSISDDFPPFDLTTNFDLTASNNALYKLNSIYGGVIIPRGTSIVGLDLRKTKIRPKYVPNPTNDNIERSALFRVTGGCYLWQFSMFDADPNGVCYTDYTTNTFVPNFSHHKLSCFEYADGVNNVNINDVFLTYSDDRTDLDMYYEKIGLAYGQSSGRTIEPDYPSSALDIQPKIDEYRIVGSTGLSVGISSIYAGDGVTSTTTITVVTDSAVTGLDVDTPFRIEGVGETGYNGQFVVSEKVDDLTIEYLVQNAPVTTPATATGARLSLQSDTVTSASPYLFNISLRSVYGMCGVLADGAKATGFKSMVIAQFTGIGLQKDDRAFVVYNDGVSTGTSGTYQDSSVSGNETLSNNSRAIFKPNYRNFHIKATNDAFIQNVSVFAIGYAEHFSVESGGDMSITNSNSNFGAKALVASGFRNNAFSQDDQGYITHVIPPKEISIAETAIEFNSIDVTSTVGVASTAHLYLYNETNIDSPPENVIDGYRVGARENDQLNVLVSFGGSVTEYSSRIVMPNSQSSSEKSFTVSRSISGANSISNDTLSFTSNHTFLSGESIRILSDSGQIPDGLEPNTVYYAIVDASLASNEIKIAKTQNDALAYTPSNLTNIDINSSGGALTVVSRVSDKNSGDIGHPVQYDSSEQKWYVNVASASTENSIYSTIVGLGTTSLGDASPRTYIKRKSDNRGSIDTVYRVRYVIPKGSSARPPSDGFILQESNTSIGSTDGEIAAQFSNTGTIGLNQQRNFKIIADATWSSPYAYFSTELPHDLTVGSQVEIVNVKSTNNTTAASNSGFNRTYSVVGITSAKQFYVGLATNPGTFTNDTSSRTTSLPYFKRKNYNNTFYVYRTQEAQQYVSGRQDGIYYLTLLNASNSPTNNQYGFQNEKYSQPVKELYPQTNRDNPVSDPEATKSYASSSLIGEVYVDDVRKSITKETLQKVLGDSDVGVGITDIVSSGVSTHVIHSEIDHGLNRVTKVSVTYEGAGYGTGSGGEFYNVQLVGFAGSTTGYHATAKVTVSAGGTITDVRIIDGGSAYGIGNTLAVVGIATTTGYDQGYVTVTNIYDNVGDTIQISGIASASYADYNNLYRITQVSVGAAKSFVTASATGVDSYSSAGVGVTLTSDAFAYLTGRSIPISALTYNATTGIGIVTTSSRHGLSVDKKVRFSGFNQSVYNGDFVVTDNLSQTSFSVNIGVGTYSPTATGTAYVYLNGYTSNDGVITTNNENISGRMVSGYAGITTELLVSISTPNSDEIVFKGVDTLDVNVGDYFQVEDEIVRIKGPVSNTITAGTPIKIYRGVLGTKAATHTIDTVVKRVDIKPVELRRHSIMRASGHTFEYVGFGPGNYSTAFPDKQNRSISAQEELLAQSTRKDGGINFYTGMNDKGISYSGNKKLSTVTGQEEIFDTPVVTVTGEDIGEVPSINVINPLEGNFTRSIRVEGGEDGKATSEFNGPVIFRNKVTSTSDIESNSLFLQGDSTVSRKYTVGISTPSLAGNPGDVVYYETPTAGNYIGWVFTADNAWHRFGSISLDANSTIGMFDKVGIATTSPGDCTFRVGAGSSLFCVDGTGVGIGTTANAYELNVIGDAQISGDLTLGGDVSIGGSVTSTYFIGDGSLLTNLNASATGWTNISGGIYNTSLNSVGIGTSVPRFNLEVGSVGSSSTTLYVNGESRFIGLVTTSNLYVGGALTATSYNLSGGTGQINAGIVTSSNLAVGTGGTIITTSSGNVGVGTTVPRAKFDIEGHARFKTYSENVSALSIASNIVNVDLSQAQTFTLTANATINEFRLQNIPSGSTAFSIKITQDSVPVSVGIDTFRTSGGSPIPVYWPGGVAPTVTATGGASDIYSFKIFDGDNPTTSGLYGVIGGQNFL